jgi:predicted MPP superfamily phosphohydrolase
MNISIIHLSDLHYRLGWCEAHGVVLEALFNDLKHQLEHRKDTSIYLAFSGDIVQAGNDISLYDEFMRKFDSRLIELNIPKKNRICVPGNHDVSIKQIETYIVDHEGVVCQGLTEIPFNNYVSSDNVFNRKFDNYSIFEQKFADLGVISGSNIYGKGWDISKDIGVYCLNSALCSSGGLKNVNGTVLVDKKRLAIETRNLHSWVINSKTRWKILIMHHPLDWLIEWAGKELKTLLNKNFALFLSGHAHDQSSFHSITKGISLVESSAPPLFTSKTGELGYSIISINPEKGVSNITYRQWTKFQSFVAGVNFSNTEDGRVWISGQPDSPENIPVNNPSNMDFINRYFTKRLDDALVSFSSQPKIWIDPIICNKAEVARDAESATRVDLTEFLSVPISTIIIAPPQFGLTCLALYLAREAWNQMDSSLWIYLDCKTLKPNTASIEQTVNGELNLLGRQEQDIKCIILDSWMDHEKDTIKLLQKVCDRFKNIPIIVMQTLDSSCFLSYTEGNTFDREFEVLFLWALPKTLVRKVVSKYNESKHIGDEDSVTTKVVADLEVLNLHRTPLNCLTMLKVSEIDFDESPVNRSEMIKRVLFLLFNVDNIPTYKIRPDLKDSEYVLGYFCETMLRENNYCFTRDRFLSVLEKCCKERFIDLEVQVVFDVLHSNYILVKRQNMYCFRFSFWIYYFAAQRMHHNQEFAHFIFEDMRYSKYPEIMEFYTGIDRQREDALQILIKDIRKSSEKVHGKSGLPDGLNPFRFAQWTPTEAALEQMQNELNEGVQSSNLPNSVKDHYSDRQYDRSSPYNQEIRDILSEYSYVYMVQVMRAGARALRNSDYVEPEIKRQLLSEIMYCWEQVSKVLLILMPMLAEKGYASFGGQVFLLTGDFGDTPEEKLFNILYEMPANVVNWFQNDLFSQKMGPLLIDHLGIEENSLSKHELILLLIKQRPREWKAQIHDYISSISRNSFYLWDVYRNLRAQYRYSHATAKTLYDIEYLIKMAAAKHITGSKTPGVKLINKIDDDALPPREVDVE